MYVGKVFKEPITMANPLVVPEHGFGQHIHRALDAVYTHEGKVFQGSIKDYVEMGRQVGFSEGSILQGFHTLVAEGLLTIDFSTMTFFPTQKMIDRYIQI